MSSVPVVPVALVALLRKILPVTHHIDSSHFVWLHSHLGSHLVLLSILLLHVVHLRVLVHHEVLHLVGVHHVSVPVRLLHHLHRYLLHLLLLWLLNLLLRRRRLYGNLFGGSWRGRGVFRGSGGSLLWLSYLVLLHLLLSLHVSLLYGCPTEALLHVKIEFATLLWIEGV